MSDGLIPRRYAKALYKYAVENGDAQEIYELLKTLSFRYTAIDELKRAVLNPEISDEEKGAYMLKLVGGKPGSSLDKFLLLCVRNNRAEYLQKISLAYVDLYREAHEIAHVVITTAAPHARGRGQCHYRHREEAPGRDDPRDRAGHQPRVDRRVHRGYQRTGA